jgi:hypothetical protein
MDQYVNIYKYIYMYIEIYIYIFIYIYIYIYTHMNINIYLDNIYTHIYIGSSTARNPLTNGIADPSTRSGPKIIEKRRKSLPLIKALNIDINDKTTTNNRCVIYIFICTYMCMYVYIYVHIYVCIIYVYIYMYISLPLIKALNIDINDKTTTNNRCVIYIFICIYIHAYVCIYICAYICVYYMCIYIYIYVYISAVDKSLKYRYQ